MNQLLVPILRNLYPFVLTPSRHIVFTWARHCSLSRDTCIHSQRPTTISLLPETYKLTCLFCMLRSNWNTTHGSTNNNKHRSPQQQKQSILDLLFSEFLLYLYMSVCSFSEFQLCFTVPFICLFMPVYSTATERHSGLLASDLATTDKPRQTGLSIADIDLIACTDKWHIYKKSYKNSQRTNHTSFITHPYIG